MGVIFVTGIFDLLHVEHIRFLAVAKNLGQKSKVKSQKSEERCLVVGIESDKRARKLKGTGRPVLSQQDRKEMLEALSVVDEVVILPEQFDSNEDYERIMREIDPEVYAVSENSPHIMSKRLICDKLGVRLLVVRRHNPEYSTTTLIRKIKAVRL